MPLVYQQNINDSTRFAVWHIMESEDFLLNTVILTQTIHHPHKRLQHLAGRFLLKHLNPDFPLDDIMVSSTNKPYLPSGKYHFSISHCGDYAAAIISTNTRAGIDIEIPREKIISIRKKFMNEGEYQLTELEDEQQAATLIWSAKEAVFKWYGTGSVDFKKHIHILSAEKNGEQYVMQVLFSKKEQTLLLVYAQFYKGICMAWLAG